MKKNIIFAVLIVFAISLLSPLQLFAADRRKMKTFPVRLSVLGDISDRASEHSYYYFTLPPNVQKVIGLDYGLLATRISSVYGLQLSFVSLSEEITGLQIAGIAAASDSVAGLQIGGISSISDSVTGLQFGGIAAVSFDRITGLQIAGIFSGTENLKGLQLGGLVSYAEEMKGLQTGGLVAGADEVTGLQLSTLMSAASDLTGLQLSVLGVFAENMTGVQLSGVIGAGTVNGIAISPLRLFGFQDRGNTGITISAISFGGNYFGDGNMVYGAQIGALNIGGGNIKGLQFGAINHATYVDGVQIGIINYSSGLHGLQIGAINICPQAKIPVLPVVNMKF